MKGYLYIITNKFNDKKYVGKTYVSIQARWRDHIKKSKLNPDRPLYRAINKYGIENFYIEEYSSFEEGDLELEEVSLISKLDSYKNGYNATLGGDGKRYITVSDDEIIDSFNKLQSVILVHRCLGIAEHSIRAVLVSNKINIDAKAAHLKAMNKALGKRILCLDTGITYDSMSDCARDIIEAGLSDSSSKSISNSISRVVSGERPSYLGMKFMEA